MRLHNQGSCILLAFSDEEIDFLRQDIGLGEEVIVSDAIFGLHFGNGFVHEIFASDVEGIGEMVNFLVGEQIMIDIHLDGG